MGLFSPITNALFGRPPQFDSAAAIRDQSKENRVNTFNPFGSTRFSRGEDGLWSANTAYSPEMQPLFDRSIRSAGTMPQFTPGNYSDMASSAEKATFDRGRNLLQPVFDQRNRAFEQSMANRGLPLGGEAYNDAFNLERGSQDNQLENLALSSVLAGRNEQGRLFDQDLAGYGANQGTNAANYAQLAQILSQLQPTTAAPVDVTGPQLAQYQARNNARQGDVDFFGQLLNGGASFFGGRLGRFSRLGRFK